MFRAILDRICQFCIDFQPNLYDHAAKGSLTPGVTTQKEWPRRVSRKPEMQLAARDDRRGKENAADVHHRFLMDSAIDGQHFCLTLTFLYASSVAVAADAATKPRRLEQPQQQLKRYESSAFNDDEE